MNRNAEYSMNEELMLSTSISEAVQVIKKYYDLDNCKPSPMMKQIVLPKIVTGLKTLGAKPRREYA